MRFPTRTLRTAAAAILLGMIAGCVRPNYAERWPNRLLLSAGPQPGYGIKRVLERQPPATLVGDDGSVCRTSRERFRKTQEGRWIACSWTLPTLDSLQIPEPRQQPGNRQIATRD
jgi:hypothetical protein